MVIEPISDISPTSPPRVLVELNQGSYFTILPRKTEDQIIPEWYSGNIYSMHRAPPTAVKLLGALNMDGPTIFDVFVSGDYEVGV